ncbi:MAG: sirohydrochlorin cobaltochelatase [Deltaproteobacteria bacterium]|nr:MAG: sirohydrochlorin cobaltochelatase [Deltaproteobacteria bacterium]
MIGKKRGILVVSFGTSYAAVRKSCIESVEKKIAETFSGYEVRRAFTSGMVIKKIKERDKIFIDNPEEALLKMKKEGFKEVVVQPLHIIPGVEYEKVKEAVEKFKNGSFKKIVLGRPVLYDKEDYGAAVRALKIQIPKLDNHQMVVFMGHGTCHFSNACYTFLQSILNVHGLNVFVATVEGYPELKDIIPELKARGIIEITLMPYMLVAGDHVINDMAGEKENSWKNILIKAGFKVDMYLHGLGENPAYQDIYVQHVQDIIGEPLEKKGL